MKMHVRACVALALLIGCTRTPGRLEITRLAEGEWIVVDATSDAALLLELHSTRSAGRRAVPQDPAVALLTDTLRTVTPQIVSLTGRQTPLRLARVAYPGDEFYYAPDGRPQLKRSPADRDLYAFEHEDAIWVFNASDRSLRKLTRDTGLDSLRAKQREGEIILYWSADPMWSADGEFIAFMTNRDFVRANTQGQGIWVVSAGTGVEKDIFNVPGVSVHTDGVFGEEFLFSSNRAPGVFGVHPREEYGIKHSDGLLLAAHRGGRGMMISENGRAVIVRETSRDTLLPLPRGHVYGSVQFSPSGERVAFFSTDQQGGYTLHVRLKPNHTASTPVPGGPSYGPAWISEDEMILAAARPRTELATYRVRLR